MSEKTEIYNKHTYFRSVSQKSSDYILSLFFRKPIRNTLMTVVFKLLIPTESPDYNLTIAGPCKVKLLLLDTKMKNKFVKHELLFSDTRYYA